MIVEGEMAYASIEDCSTDEKLHGQAWQTSCMLSTDQEYKHGMSVLETRVNRASKGTAENRETGKH